MRLRKLVIAFAAACVVLIVGPAASAAPLLQMQVELGGRVARDRPGEEPIRLEPKRKTPLRIVVTNKGDEAANVRHVQLDGEALGLKFLTYDVSVAQRVPPGARRVITVPLDLYDLGNQATGYLPASVRLLDAKREELAQQKFVVDVRGKSTSTLGIFALALLVLAFVSLGMLIYKTVRRQLSRNRAVRGLQFMLAGLAVGLLLALGLPILRITSIQPDGWIPLALGPMAIGFALGYLAPGPLSYSIEEARDEEILDIYASQALERLSAEQTAAAAAVSADAGRRSGETVVSGAAAAATHGAAATTVTPGERSSGPAPATTVTPGERSSGPAPVTTVTPGERSSGPAPATTAEPVSRPSGPAPATTAEPVSRPSGPAPATTAEPVSRPSGPAPATTAEPVSRPSGPAPATTAEPVSRPSGPAPATTVTPSEKASPAEDEGASADEVDIREDP